MGDIAINYLALVVAAFAATALGALWYTPKVFGTPWMRAAGITPGPMSEADKKGMLPRVLVGFVCQLVTAYVFVHFASLFGVASVSGALQLAFWAWLGFTAVTTMQPILWEKKPIMYFVINAGYQLASFVLIAVILTLWK